MKASHIAPSGARGRSSPANAANGGTSPGPRLARGDVVRRGDAIDRAPASGTGPRWTGWSDVARGINANLGDTEAAVHLFYERHRQLGGRPPADGTPLATRLKELHLWSDAKSFARSIDPAETYWRHDDSRTLFVSGRDREVARTIYAAQTPHAASADRNASEAPKLRTLERFVAQNRYDATIDRALAAHPTAGIDAKTVKALLVQESGLDPNVGTNAAGYSGIAQLGTQLATVARANDPFVAIDIAAKALQDKAASLEGDAFARYGAPTPEDRTRFVVAAYNAGQGTIGHAIDDAFGHAYASARGRGRDDASARHDAAASARRWTSLVAPSDDPARSPLYRAIPAAWGKAAKYVETSSYADDIVMRARP